MNLPHIFGGLMLGLIIGGHSGGTVTWMIVGALVCGGFWATNYIRDHQEREKRTNANDQS